MGAVIGGGEGAFMFCFFPLFFPFPADERPNSRMIRTGRRRVNIILLSKVVDYIIYFVSSLGSVRTINMYRNVCVCSVRGSLLILVFQRALCFCEFLFSLVAFASHVDVWMDTRR
jgi:hypothetical protein